VGAATRPDPFASNEAWRAAGIPVPGEGADYRVRSVEALNSHVLHVEHCDGVKGTVCFTEAAFRGAFEPLRNPTLFKEARVEHGWVVWNDDLDLAPDNMHRHLFAFGEWILR